MRSGQLSVVGCQVEIPDAIRVEQKSVGWVQHIKVKSAGPDGVFETIDDLSETIYLHPVIEDTPTPGW